MPSVNVKYVNGMQFEGVSGSGHHIVMDAAPDFGGNNSGVRPMELALVALGGCTGIDVVSMLKKMRVDVIEYAMDIDGDRQNEHPKVFTKITLNYRFKAPDDAGDKIKRAVHLSQEKYCSVSAMLARSAIMVSNIYLNDQLLDTFEHQS